jgi:hypothetical protein
MIRKGTIVRLKGKKKTARVVSVHFKIKGGVFLDTLLDGFRYWHVKELERVQ